MSHTVSETALINSNVFSNIYSLIFTFELSFLGRYVFDYHPGEVYWCTADVGWITGHSYVIYGPLANGATSVIVSQRDCY